MFNNSKYTKYYFNIVANAQARELITGFEKHHIIPKSLGGSNSKDNIVKLTAREHYICHLLLVRMVNGKARSKMVYALWILSNRTSTRNSRLYQSAREAFIKTVKGRKHTPEAIEKMRAAQKGKVISEEHKNLLRELNTGLVRHFSEEHKQNLSKSGKGRVITPEWRAKLSAANKGQGKGRTLSPETKAKLSAARKRTLAAKANISK